MKTNMHFQSYLVHFFLEWKTFQTNVEKLETRILSEQIFNLRRTERDMIKNVFCSLCKVPVIFVRL